MTTSFYVPSERISGTRFSLSDEEARHASRVLRLAPGDEIVLVDGAGGWYGAVIDYTDKRSVGGHILETRREVGEPDYELTIAMALVKNRNRFETFLEKAVELGVSRVVPLITSRTEKEGFREQRAEGILVAAMKQSGRSRLTSLESPVALSQFLDREGADLGFCCHERAGGDSGILARLRSREGARKITVLVGPEGGFTDEEVVLADHAGYTTVSLGSRRLRAETAAIAAAAAVSLSFEAT